MFCYPIYDPEAYDEDRRLDEEYEAYMQMEYEKHLDMHDEEDYIYQNILIPQYFEDLEIFEKSL